jgi:Fe2+ transport system protein FeoA
MIRCQLCGFEFDPDQLTCHPACPLHSRCNLICCPNCGYQAVDASRSRAAGWLRRWWKAKTPDQADAPAVASDICPLVDLPLGTEAEIEAMDELDAARLARLSVYGLCPGSRVCLLQRHPACVIRTGETELALSRDILAQIRVRPLPKEM